MEDEERRCEVRGSRREGEREAGTARRRFSLVCDAKEEASESGTTTLEINWDLESMAPKWNTIHSLSLPLQGISKDTQHEQVIWLFKYGLVQRNGP